MSWLQLGMFDEFRRMNIRQMIYQGLNFAMIVSSALMFWKGLIVVTGCDSPIVVVLTGSMEPAFCRGDLLLLTNHLNDPIRAGDITVFKLEGREIPIVHRVIKVHEDNNMDTVLLTKGDNNPVDDRGLYPDGLSYLTRDHIIGRAKGIVPHIGVVGRLLEYFDRSDNNFDERISYAEMGNADNNGRICLTSPGSVTIFD